MKTRPSSVLMAAFLVACSSGSKTAPSAQPSASTASKATQTPSAAVSAPAPKPTSTGPKLALQCPEAAFHHEDPEFCLQPQLGGKPGVSKPDGEWRSIEIGPMATVSFAKVPLDAAVSDVKKVWGDDVVIGRSHYEAKVDGDKTIVRYKSFDPDDDPKALEAMEVLIVFGKSGDYTVRCEIDGSMTTEDVCLGLALPPAK